MPITCRVYDMSKGGDARVPDTEVSLATPREAADYCAEMDARYPRPTYQVRALFMQSVSDADRAEFVRLANERGLNVGEDAG